MRMKLFGIIICTITLLTASFSFAETPKEAWMKIVKEAKAEVNSISAKELMTWIQESRDFRLVDVREKYEVSAAKIEASNFVNIPRGLLDPLAAKKGVLDVDETIVIYCKAGARGALAGHMLKRIGYKNVYNLEGGINEWIRAGNPVTNGLGTFKAVPYKLTGCAE
ncbi:rhodanese-like domain-containing protein [Limisalsivibrio acetivorans]|uniref:rhodanese-like domain-containing protein n=1 Tax=Limisalsivibrio acetivorans TaxID=1304888 RepID=UPI0003B33326|nr:rhodanese-like domain-containing protein [Limisalsivibrio acetivorans]